MRNYDDNSKIDELDTKLIELKLPIDFNETIFNNIKPNELKQILILGYEMFKLAQSTTHSNESIITEMANKWNIKYNSSCEKYENEIELIKQRYDRECKKLENDLCKVNNRNELLQEELLGIKTSGEKMHNENYSDVSQKLDEILKVFCSKSNHDKGRIGENFLFNYLSTNFADSSIIDKHSETNCGDIWLTFSDGITILIESKNKMQNKLLDINKFIKDTRINNVNGGLYVCLQNKPIPNHNDLSIAFVDDKPIGYITDVFNAPIKICVMIKALKILCKEKNENDHSKIQNVLNNQKSIIKQVTQLKTMSTRQLKTVESFKKTIMELEKLVKESIIFLEKTTK